MRLEESCSAGVGNPGDLINNKELSNKEGNCRFMS